MRPLKTLAILAGLVLGWNAHATEIRIALDCPPDPAKCGSYVFAHAFAEHLKANGLSAREMPVGSIGGEAERLDQTAQGLLEVNMADLARAAQLEKSVSAFMAPYLFDSLDHLDRSVARSDLMSRINASLSKKGVRIIALVATGGGNGLFNVKHPIAKPEDLKDLRMRALDENQLKLFQAWGGNGVVITMPEVATAFQTGTAHGYVNAPFVPFMFGHADILKFYTDAKVTPSLRVAMIAEDWYKGLSDKDRGIVDDAAVKALAANRAWVGPSDTAALAQLEKAGVSITRLAPESRARFRDLSRPAWTAVLNQAEIQPYIDAAEKGR
ncbi:TRAP transporter substrate-binding protein [Microvirga pudoricolor]|uniref:TRAP transporter substrate-binding protein n=1 Tax=Microvirga pudoricolor TaxID=2778729 RepID=UPI00194F7287|nr:TRAP transporter substrate-binding protein [Microvirga pudoricolor]MBM6593628.1 TRAP transporter substrate-binding protein [Microvirga pudoricolor]